MKKQSLFFCFTFLILSLSVHAGVPIVWQNDTSRIRTDELQRVYIYPCRIMKASGVQQADVLLNRGNGQPEMGKRGMAAIRTLPGDTATLILDYGRELHGGLKIVTGSSSRRQPSLVRIRFGESVQECSSTPCDSAWKKGYSTDDHAMRDITMHIPRDGQIELGNTGFRFVRIDLLQPNATLYIKETPAILRYRDVPYLGSFTCNDTLLNRIWLTGAYTVHLNMQEYLWDGIKRDRLVWLGDMHPEVSTLMAVFGNNSVVERSLDLACSQFPLPGWMNNMTSYSMWYLIIQWEWYMHNADRAFLDRHKSYILGLLDQFDKAVDADGNIKGNYFLDWPSSPNKQGVEAGVQALLVWALRDAQCMCRMWKDEARYATCQAVINRLSRHVKDVNGLKQAAALMALAGLSDSQKMFDKYLVKQHEKAFSTFYGYYMLMAEAMAGQYTEALNVIRRFWGGMLKMGATTFWEDFDMSWMHDTNPIDEFGSPDKKNIHGDFGGYCYPGYRCSLCHGWASGPTAWLSRYVLGIEIVEPGCKTLRIRPHLGDLQWAEGTFPTPYGVVKVRHERGADGKIITRVSKPDAITVVE